METLASYTRTKSIYLDELLQSHILQTLIRDCTTALRAPSAIISASQFSKRYSYFLLAPSLRQLLTSGKFASLHSYDYMEMNCETGDFQLIIEENASEFPFNHCSKTQLDHYIQHYFANHLVPIWMSISTLTGIKMDLLWENAYIYISWMCLHQVKSPRAKENFLYLTKEADGSLFGLSENPFASFAVSSSIRKKCCLYFMLPSADGGKCKTCPLNCEK